MATAFVTVAPNSIAQAQTSASPAPSGTLPQIQVVSPKQVRAAKPARPARRVATGAPRQTRRSVRPAAPIEAVPQQPAAAVAANNGGDSLKPLGGKLPEPQITHPVTQSISVIEHGIIEQTSPAGLLDVLSAIPGISIARSGGIGGQIYLRGFSSNNFRSPLYVDGDRFRGRNTLQLNYFSPEEIERVEVIRGPASVIYGSEALTGLVNIITKSPAGDPQGPFRITGGGWSAGYGSAANSFNTYDWLQGAGGGIDFLAGIAGRRGDNYLTPKGEAPNSDYRSLGGSFKLGYTPTLGQRFELTLRDYSEVDGRAGGVGGAPGAPFLRVRQDPNEVQSARLGYSGEFDGVVKHVEASVYANYFETTLTTVNNTFNPAGVATRTVNSNSHVIGPLVTGGRIQGMIPWVGEWGESKTTFGADTFHEERPGSESFSQTTNRNAAGAVTSVTNVPLTKNGPDTTQTNVGAFVLHEWTPIQPLTLSAGGRYDFFNTTTGLSPLPAATLPAFIGKTDVDASAPTGSVGLVYRILPTVDLLANVATSYRQPTNSELFNATATTVPNPTLAPERGVTYEGGARLHVANAELKVTAFNSHYENFLQTVPVVFNGLAGFTQAQNVGEAEVSGVEIEERWQVTRTVNVFGGFASLRGTNTVTGKPLPFLAPYRGRIGVQYAEVDGSYSILGVVDWAARKSRIDPAMEFETAGYAIPKIYATLQLGKLINPRLGNTKLILGLENPFDTAYRDASTFTNVAFAQSLTNPLLEVGRNVTVKVQHTF